HLVLEGLMTIAPFTADEELQRRTFRGLRSLRDALKEDRLWLVTLSMGMSADYGIAVEEGATVIRLGTVLFGPRATGAGPEAPAEARRVLDAAGAAKADVERQAAEVQRQYHQYVGGFRALLERQLAELRALYGQHGG